MTDAIPLTSASQISDFERCQRMWAFRTVAKIRSPPTAKQLLGIDVDSGQLQPYLEKGQPLDFTRKSGEIAATALPFLPTPGTVPLKCQKHFILPSPTGEFAYQGYLDVWIEPTTGCELPIVDDFKTTGDLKWAKTSDELANDTQAVLYGTWAMVETGAGAVDLQWIYMRTRDKPKAEVTYWRMTREDIGKFHRIDGVARELVKTRRRLEVWGDKNDAALSLPASPSACWSFGGCPHFEKCNLPLDQVFDAYAAKEGIDMSEVNLNDVLAKLGAKKAEAAPTPAPEAPPTTPTALPGWMTSKEDPRFPAKGINPPESALPPPPPAPVEAAKPKREGKKKKEEPGIVAPVPQENEVVTKPKGSPDFVTADQFEALMGPDTVTVTRAAEKHSPIPFHTLEIGPFSITSVVKPGETRGDVMRKALAELNALFIEERANAFDQFKRWLAANPPVRQ